MAKSSTKTAIDASTEEKIRRAARKVFTSKGYAATKVRDIAAEADINLSLVNYYFRSKEKLFELIMAETVQNLFEKIQPILNNELTSPTEKIENIAAHYLDLLLENPELPLFFVNEIMSGSNKLPKMVNGGKLYLNSYFLKQLMSLQKEGKLQVDPINVLMNILGLIVFPFLARPLLIRSGTLKPDDFRKIIEERKKLVPLWVAMIIGL